MSNLNNVIAAYNELRSINIVEEAKKIKAKFELEKQLLSTDDLEVIEFQYECLGDKSDDWAYLTCRAAFAKRKNIESYLLTKFDKEKSLVKRADVIHILGRIRSEKALPLALVNVNESDVYLREICLYVIGWTGQPENISLLETHLINESTQKLKITAGSALRQIAWRIPEAKGEVLKALKNAFNHEADQGVVARIIELISTIAVKNLGIREDKNDPNILIGDIEKAKIKARKFLENI